MNKTLRLVVLIGIWVVPFIPLLVFNSLFFPFITGKNFVFRIIVEIIFGGWLILAFTDPAFRPRKSWILWALVAFVVAIGLADVLGVYPYKSLWSNYERMEGFVGIVHIALYTLVAATTLHTTKLWTRFWETSIGVSVLMCLYGFAQLAGWVTINQGGVRLDGRMGNATYLAVYILFHMFLTLYLMTERTRKSRDILIGSIILILQFVILYYTATRGAMLGLIGGLFLTSLLIIIFEKERRIIKKTAVGIIVGVLIVVIGFLSLRSTSFVQESPVLSRFASISISDTTTLSRFVIWKMAWEGFKERPILGWGQENFNYVFNAHYDPVLYNQEQWFDRTHNVIFDWLIAGGILGLITYLSLYVSVLWYMWRKSSGFTVTEKSILTGLLVGYFIHNLFVFDNLTSYILFFSLIAYVYARTCVSVPSSSSTESNRIIAPVVVVVLVLVMYGVNIQPLRANMRIIDALTPRQNGNVVENLQDFKTAIDRNTFGTAEAREHLLQFTQQIITLSSLPVGTQEMVAYAKEQAQAQIQEAPEDARHYALYGLFLLRTFQLDEAIVQFKKALELSPNKQSLLFELGAAYASDNDFINAAHVFKKAYDVAPQNLQAKLVYIASLIYVGDNATATELMKSIDENTLTQSDYILQAYYDTKQYKKVIDIIKVRIAGNPENTELHLSLAATYSLVGDKTNAIAEIRKVMQLDPTFQKQGEEYIKQVQSGKTL